MIGSLFLILRNPLKKMNVFYHMMLRKRERVTIDIKRMILKKNLNRNIRCQECSVQDSGPRQLSHEFIIALLYSSTCIVVRLIECSRRSNVCASFSIVMASSL